LSVIVDVIVPIFGLVAFGYGATYTRVFGAAAAEALASFVFYFAIPVLLFRSMATTALPETMAWGYLASYFLGAFAVFALGMTLASTVIAEPERRAIIGFGCGFGNTVLLGIPLVLTGFGEAASLPLYLLLAFHSSVLFTAVTVVVEVGRGTRADLRDLPLRIGRGLVTNPILWGLLGGVLFNLAGLTLPAAVDRGAALMAGAALPCALFSMGASLRPYRITGALAPAMLMVTLKLLVHPLIVWALATLVFDVPPLWAKVAILIAALPVGVNVFLFGVRYGTGEAESAAAILLSSLLSVGSVALVLFWLGVGGSS
jgi:malonate transporter